METPQGISYEPIIERIEQVRKGLEMNKTRFAASAGLKPQTYNNFIGAQGSKPSLALVMGVAAAHTDLADRPSFLYWLLFGDGEPPALRQADRIGALEAEMEKMKDHTHHLPRDATHVYEVYNTKNWSGPPRYA